MVDDHPSKIRARIALKERDLHAAESCASELENFGFDVTSVGDRGISFEGAADTFESVFVSRVIVEDTQPSFATKPVPPARLADLVESVYFPTRPTFFT